MKKRIFLCLLVVLLLCPAVRADDEVLRWVDFNVPYESLNAALEIDIASQGAEKALSWIDVLALAATRTGGSGVTVQAVRNAAHELYQDRSPEEFLGSQYKYFVYYQRAFGAVLGGLVGSYAIETEDPVTGEKEWTASYGLKAFSPIAAGYRYSHCPDFGKPRSYGFARPHLGNDLMGTLGTPIVAVEGGTVEALGWNQYGGWRIGIRSDDRLRYYD